MWQWNKNKKAEREENRKKGISRGVGHKKRKRRKQSLCLVPMRHPAGRGIWGLLNDCQCCLQGTCLCEKGLLFAVQNQTHFPPRSETQEHSTEVRGRRRTSGAARKQHTWTMGRLRNPKPSRALRCPYHPCEIPNNTPHPHPNSPSPSFGVHSQKRGSGAGALTDRSLARSRWCRQRPASCHYSQGEFTTSGAPGSGPPHLQHLFSPGRCPFTHMDFLFCLSMGLAASQ